jgi:precorrin-2/cobalt-factor-2 C20-methyltransferase
VPAADDLAPVRRALATGGTVVLMKVGSRLQEILRMLDDMGLLEHSVFVARAGLDRQRVAPDLRQLRSEQLEAGYLSVILVDANRRPAS